MRPRASITENIPGGWYGNDPGAFTADNKQGNVMIDAECAVDAIRWLARRAKILKTRAADDGGLFLSYQAK